MTVLEAQTSIRTCKMCDRPARDNRSVYCSAECFNRNERESSRRRWATFSPERKRATTLVATAILNGTLKPQPCEACGTGRRGQAHHDDYAKPLDVRWLCGGCHKRHHIKFGPGRNA